ncbi:MAG: inorganic diphosphatase [Paracoccus sp. (in: a-proteobacteria)]|uniref:inorganic diphosphatase n=1 Tax=Paracoccus sp. TaxID=267 RepID=UPI0026DFB24C|nr:inorganic diphosphatase [Paracoccus sp. (in: a-proteobacteria)]MDO5632776.1 inorganic diphosphatase [Paracoccus sp. (in: a-proteobacteria)]
MLKLTAAALTLAAFATPAAAETIGGLAYADTTRIADAMLVKDKMTIVGTEDLMAMSPLNDDGTIKAVIEIPTGTSAKWEMSKDDPKAIYWELRNDAPRIVNYLGYPGNYGAIPGTDLPQELGGDGDPLDVLVLGQAVPRGEVVNVRLIGVMKMLDDGEQDDKLIAVLTENSPFAGIESLAQMDAEFPGVTQIVELWLSNYKGPNGGMESQGFAEADEARKVLEQAVAQYQASH